MVPSMFGGDGGCVCVGLFCLAHAASANASHRHCPLDSRKRRMMVGRKILLIKILS